ncbi:copper homeostasis protein [Loktanella fryxellensis]|uniref:PF03932 family protein CutC n=1 Tax=Loktanella fryxellensis TaxID=245187 RepID=A0A1H8GWU0_9RHOB|nr:copper homeostasis protein CutC [Loktanella fryxellensis]SEN48280.1 copper homeostasis protein [Loktanella fryxellensis]
MILLEICVDDIAGLNAALAGGADRIELCAALALGGLTPPPGLMQHAGRGPLPAFAMIRPRAGDFVWDAAEVAAQIADIAAARAAGLAGVVIGASHPDGSLDAGVLAQLVEAARGLDITLHRAIDLTPDVGRALAVCRDLGIGRVLSSGGALTALDGGARLAAMQAAGGVTVMPGGGITAQNVARLAHHLHLAEVHASCSAPLPAPTDVRIADFGFQPPGARGTDATRVRALRLALDQLGAGFDGAGTTGCTSS